MNSLCFRGPSCCLARMRHDRIDAPWLIDRPMNSAIFRSYVENVLQPTLRPDEIVVMDNLGSHRNRAVRAAIRRSGAKLFLLPKYSPDLNPIEQVFAKLKHLLRKACARSRQTVSETIGELLNSYSPAECEAYIRNAGYGST